MYGRVIKGRLETFSINISKEEAFNKGFFIVPENIISGYKEEWYDDNYNLYSNQQLLEKGLLVISNRQKIVKNAIVDKTKEELILDKLEPLPDHLKIENKTVIIKTEDELYLEKIISREEWLDVVVRPKRNKLVNDIDLIYCNSLNVKNMVELEIENWMKYKKELLDFTKIAEPDKSFPKRSQ